jgi:formylglycine-generating enzyme required for sulfatase activity
LPQLIFKIVEEYNCPRYQTGEEIHFPDKIFDSPDEKSICLELYQDIKNIIELSEATSDSGFFNCHGCIGMIRLTYGNGKDDIPRSENKETETTDTPLTEKPDKPVLKKEKETQPELKTKNLEKKKRKRFIITEKKVVIKENGKITSTEKKQAKVEPKEEKKQKKDLILTSKGIIVNKKGGLAQERDLIEKEKEELAREREKITLEKAAIKRKAFLSIAGTVFIAAIVVAGILFNNQQIKKQTEHEPTPPAVAQAEKKKEVKIETKPDHVEDVTPEPTPEEPNDQFFSRSETTKYQPVKVEKSEPQPAKIKKAKPPPAKVEKARPQPARTETVIPRPKVIKKPAQKSETIKIIEPEQKKVKKVKIAYKSSKEKPEPFKSKPNKITSFVTYTDKKYGKNSIGMKFVYIPSGTFMMGSHPNAPIRDEDEKYHQVSLTEGFYMQATEVTQAQWKAVMGDESVIFPFRPFFKKCGGDCPMENISWNDTQEFIRKLNQKEKTHKYRLPTEAEWEYACNARNNESYCYGNDKNKLKEYSWYKNNSGKKTHPVGQKKPNDWGLYDMHGNLWEWCRDWKGEYPSGSVINPTGSSKGLLRVCRGGSWRNYAGGVRSAYRDYVSPYRGDNFIGFRMVRMP